MRCSKNYLSLKHGWPILAILIAIVICASPSPANAQTILDYFTGSSDEEPKKKVKPKKKKSPPAKNKTLKATKKSNPKPSTIGVIGGDPDSTALQMVYDLSLTLDKKSKLRILPIVGRGAEQNIDDLLRLDNIDLAITQSDVLSARLDKIAAKNRKRKLTYISKLCNSELHLVASTAVTSLDELNGVPVNFGAQGSGTQFTARKLFTKLGITPIEVNFAHADAFHKLASGEIAATLIVAGKPARALTNLRSNAKFHFLAIPYGPAFHEIYLPTNLTSADYPDLIRPGENIDTLAVSTVLITKNHRQRTKPYRQLSSFVDHFFTNLKRLQQPPRHNKWQETNLAASLAGWDRFKPAATWLEKEAAAIAKQQATQQRVTPERAHALALKLAPENPTEQQRLFDLFTGKALQNP